MKRNAGKSVSQQGFSIIELMFVVTIIAILVAAAFPSFMSWRRSIEYRTVARDIVSTLRDARSKSLATNRNYQVQFDAALRRYGVRKGNRSRNTNWADTTPGVIEATQWTALTNEVNISSNIDYSSDPDNITGLVFNPDGTIVLFNPGGAILTTATVTVLDSTLNPKIAIDIIASGKIKTR